jgi:Fur family transcriptional regulator, ferric uptake regulator
MAEIQTIQETKRAQPEGHSRIFEHLRKIGVRATSARVCVLQMLQTSQNGSLAAEQIFQQLSEIGIRISLGTIYRVLREMEASGLIEREWHFADAAGKSRYLLAASIGQPATYTFVCQGCGRNYVVADKRFSDMMYRQAEAAGFEHLLSQIVIHIRCNACAAQ